jgi:hypothetical protein
MFQRSQAIKAVSSLSIWAALAGTGLADPVEIYFSAEPYSCGSEEIKAEWWLRGDGLGALTLEAFSRRSDRLGSNFSGQEWQINEVDVATPLTLPGKNKRAKWLVSGLLDGAPLVRALDQKGAPIDGCAPTLIVATSASKRYDEFIGWLDKAEPSLEEARQVELRLIDLPPEKMLPSSERVSIHDILNQKSAEFWGRYQKASLAAAADLSNDIILPGIEAGLRTNVSHNYKG